MNYSYDCENKILVVSLEEEIDHHIAEKIRRKTDNEIQRYLPKKVVFDFSKVNFMDSAGIGLIIGRFKLINILGGKLEIHNTNETVNRILKMSGITKFIKIIDEGENKNEKCV